MVDCAAPTLCPTNFGPIVEEEPYRPRLLPLDWPTILIADDEECVRDVLRRGLEREGFGVLLAANGWEALDIYQQRWEDIAAVVLDVRMHGLDGPQTLRCMYHINPSVRACFMSGGMGNHAQTRLLQAGAVRILWKPFPLDEIAEVLREILRDSEVMACTA